MNDGDIPESEIFLLDELSEFRIKLYNQREKAEVIDYGEWIKNHGLKEWFLPWNGSFNQLLVVISRDANMAV